MRRREFLKGLAALMVALALPKPKEVPLDEEENCGRIPMHHFVDFRDENGEHTYYVEGERVSEWSESEVRRVLAKKGL